MIKSNTNSKQVKNLLDMPYDVMILIFMKLGVIEILLNVQWVCSSWRKLAKDPQLYRCIDMRHYYSTVECQDETTWHGCIRNTSKMAVEAVERSCGQLVEFSVGRYATDELLRSIATKIISLRCLQISRCKQISKDVFIEIIKHIPLLEELELCYCWSFGYFFVSCLNADGTKKVIEAVGRYCTQLKYFRFNQHGTVYKGLRGDEEEGVEVFNEDALAIARSMPQLQRLHLFGNPLTNIGLQAILSACTNLEYLDLRHCFSLYLNKDLKRKCADQISDLRLPYDSTDDYEYGTEICLE